MNPATIQKLREQTPELKEFIAYLAQKARECDILEGFEGLSFAETAYEVKVRIRTKKVILDILEPLLKDNSGLETPDPSEYVV